MISQHIVQGDVFQINVIPFFCQGHVAFQFFQPLCMGYSQFFIQLIEFHKYPGILLIECKSFFHGLQCSFCLSELVVIGQSQVTPYSREAVVMLYRRFPAFYGLFVLTGSVPEIAEVIAGFGICRVCGQSAFEDNYFFDPVGETIGRIGLWSFVVIGFGFFRLSGLPGIVSQRIIHHGIDISAFLFM